MFKLPTIKVVHLVTVLLQLGFFLKRQKGSHAIFRHPDGRKTVLAMHPGRDIPPGTLRTILREINLTTEDLLKFL